MKNLKLLILLSGIIFCLQPVVAQTIVGSAHDFSAATWNPGDEICIVCHTPHNADITVAEAPLWNHELSSVASYTVYSRPLDAGTVGQPSAESKLCLGCHDGTVALENFGGTTTGTTLISAVRPSANLNDADGLSDDHPISISYTTAIAAADGELHDPSTELSGLPGGGTIQDDLLFGDQVQCASCHDVHNTVTPVGVPSLLVVDNSGSGLCLTCHDK